MTEIIEFRVIDEGSGKTELIRPQDIELDHSFATGRFGKYEIEETAGRLVAFMQFKGRWARFTISELYKFYELKGWNPDKMFAGLTGAWCDYGELANLWLETLPLLCFDLDGSCFVTDLFIKACAER